MTVSYNLIFLIFTCVVSTDYAQGIGQAGCFVNGNYDTEEKCTLETIPFDKYPDACTAYLWFSVEVDENFNVQDGFGEKNDAFFKQFLKHAKKPVYVIYGYSSLKEWSIYFNSTESIEEIVKKEIAGLKKYLKHHKTIAGLLLYNLDVLPDQPNFPNFSQTLYSYVCALRQHLPNMKIGLHMYVHLLKKHFDNPKVEWIDFQMVDFDVVLVNYRFINPCAPEYKHTGLPPVTGNLEGTMEQYEPYLNKTHIPAKKLNLRVDVHPFPRYSDDYSYCEHTNSMMCLHPEMATEWCSDTIESYYAKGKYISEHASGFSVAHIDMDDPNNCCNCCPFPGFYAVLAGFKKRKMPPGCPPIDRP